VTDGTDGTADLVSSKNVLGLEIVAEPVETSTTSTVEDNTPTMCEENLCCGLAYRTIQPTELSDKPAGSLVVLELCHTATDTVLSKDSVEYSFKCQEMAKAFTASALALVAAALMLQ